MNNVVQTRYYEITNNHYSLLESTHVKVELAYKHICSHCGMYINFPEKVKHDTIFFIRILYVKKQNDIFEEIYYQPREFNIHIIRNKKANSIIKNSMMYFDNTKINFFLNNYLNETLDLENYEVR